jgi:hypothetical protein
MAAESHSDGRVRAYEPDGGSGGGRLPATAGVDSGGYWAASWMALAARALSRPS